LAPQKSSALPLASCAEAVLFSPTCRFFKTFGFAATPLKEFKSGLAFLSMKKFGFAPLVFYSLLVVASSICSVVKAV
jgi:hypothetical protein